MGKFLTSEVVSMAVGFTVRQSVGNDPGILFTTGLCVINVSDAESRSPSPPIAQLGASSLPGPAIVVNLDLEMERKQGRLPGNYSAHRRVFGK